ncbi:MAG: DUF4169 family protein [Rhodospirillales bacterium]|nr:DUF4169 family protein [Rhodospirillales bacterium]MBO6786672.1 DUF4169 family protein [Rhodospirillales bacterium]
MSADIINLNQYRKAKRKEEKRDKAAENRTKFGRTKAEKKADTKEREKSERLLAGKKLPEPGDDDRETPA